MCNENSEKNKKTSQRLLRFPLDPNRSRPPTRRTRSAEREGRLAQLVERLVYTEDVGSSSLSSPTILPFHSNIHCPRFVIGLMLLNAVSECDYRYVLDCSKPPYGKWY